MVGNSWLEPPNKRPNVFFSRKLSVVHRKYSVTKIELLAIVKTVKEFKGMLWGQPIVVFTDHTNLMRDTLGLTLDWVYQWRLLLEEYGPKIVYIKGMLGTNLPDSPQFCPTNHFSLWLT